MISKNLVAHRADPQQVVQTDRPDHAAVSAQRGPHAGGPEGSGRELGRADGQHGCRSPSRGHGRHDGHISGTNASPATCSRGARSTSTPTSPSSRLGDKLANASLPLPCTELAMSNIQVSTSRARSRPRRTHKSSAGGAAPLPGSRDAAARGHPGAGQTARVPVAERVDLGGAASAGATPPPLVQCIGTDQTTGAP